MAARSKVYVRLPEGYAHRRGDTFLARTDLTGHGIVREGEEFTAREMWPMGDRLMKGGRKMRVRVVRVERVTRGWHILHVEVLKDLTPPPVKQGELF